MIRWGKLLPYSINLVLTSQSRLTFSSSLANNLQRRWHCTVPAPLLSLVESLEEGWTPPKNDVIIKRNLKEQPLNSTRNWTSNDLEFFKLHYYQVTDTTLLAHVFCDNVPLTPLAKDIVEMNLPYSAIVEGNYEHLPLHKQLFADLLFGSLLPTRSEAITDDLIKFLLKICNPSNLLYAEPRRKQFSVKVGDYKFASIPDVTVEVRNPSYPFAGASLVVVEDKQESQDELDPDGNKKVKTYSKPEVTESAEFQLPGEMVAAAMHNYTEGKLRVPQTIFALRVIGTQVTFYRADFPVHYLESVKQGSPAADITIFRYGGVYGNTAGFLIEGSEKQIVIQWICNFMAACTQIAYALRNGDISHITTERIALLYPKSQPKSSEKSVEETADASTSDSNK